MKTKKAPAASRGLKEILCIKETAAGYRRLGKELTREEVEELQRRPGTVVILTK